MAFLRWRSQERNEKAARAHLLLAVFLVIAALLLVLIFSRGIRWADPYFAAFRLGVMLLLGPPAAVNGLIAWGAWRKALWARIGSIAMAVLAIAFACSGVIALVSAPTGEIGATLYGIVLSSAALAVGVYLLVNSRWD